MIKLFKQYWISVSLLLVLAFTTNILALWFPKKVGQYVDAYKSANVFQSKEAVYSLGILTLIILLTAFAQYAISSFTSERVGRDLRSRLIGTLKNQSFGYLREITSAKLITILTSDVDAIKNMVASGVVNVLMAGVTLIGAVVFLLSINWRLGLATLAVIPFIIIFFGIIFRKIGPLFGLAQMNLDRINKVINESIIASPLVRVLNAERFELSKFDEVNKKGTEIGRKVVTFFASLVPVIMLLSNISILIVLYYGGIQVAKGSLTLGQMSAFFSYTSVFVWPFFILAFSSQFISRAQVSLVRINSVLDAPTAHISHAKKEIGTQKAKFVGHIEFRNVTLRYGEKSILKDISFEIKPNSRTAIVGPTGAGKTELFYLISGLARPTEGKILIDDKPIDEWDSSELLSKIGMVFQDSIIFNTSLRENILFNSQTEESILGKAIETADLQGLVSRLPEGLETNVSERGTTLSGGQKQRVMLARALTLDPSILLLDDFTARVDAGTEERIIANLGRNFPTLTLISITQKIEPIKKYDKIIVLMEGELIANGTHEELLSTSLEYKQIYESQQSTESKESKGAEHK